MKLFIIFVKFCFSWSTSDGNCLKITLAVFEYSATYNSVKIRSMLK